MTARPLRRSWMDRQMHQFNTSAAMEGAGDDSFDGEIIGDKDVKTRRPTINDPPKPAISGRKRNQLTRIKVCDSQRNLRARRRVSEI